MKNLKKIIAVLVVFITLFSANAQQNENSLLWKIEGNNIKTSYVFGTFHMLPKGDFELKDKVSEAFKESELIVMELDMDDPTMQTAMMEVSTIPADDSLQNHMTEKEYKVLDNYFTTKIGVGMSNFNTMKPFVVSSMVMMAHLGQDMASYEATLLAMAKKDKKELKGLETVEFQMAMFDDQSYEEQLDDIIKMLSEDGGVKTYFNKMVSVYKTENIDAISNTINSYFEYDKVLQSKLLDDRNQDWIPKIAEYSKKEKVFYAVGAGHLGGNQGVIHLLKQSGYTVTPIFK